MSRGRTWVVVVLVAVGAALLGASSASASGVVCPGCTGTYTGMWTAHTTVTNDGNSATQDLSLSWTESLQTAPGAGGPVWSLASAQGTITYDLTGDTPEHCSASLTPNLALAADITEFAPQVVEGASAIAVNAAPPTYWSGDPASDPEVLVSSDDTNDNCSYTPNDTAYNSGFWTGFSGSSCHYAGTGAEAMSFPLFASTTIGDNCDVQGSDGTPGGKTGTATLSSQLTLTPPGPCGSAGAADFGRGVAFDPASVQTCCANGLKGDMYAEPDGGVFDRAAPLRLSASTPNTGCAPYEWKWQLTAGAPKGLKFNTTGGFTSTPNLTVTATCPGAKGKKGRKLNAALRACIGPVQFSVQAVDSSGRTTGFGYATNRWCVPGTKGKADRCTPQLNAKLKAEFLAQADHDAREGLAAVGRELATIAAEALTSPGAGSGAGKVLSKAQEYIDAVTNGKRVSDAAATDADLADKARQAAADDPPAGNLSMISLPRPPPPRVPPCGHLARVPAGAVAADCAALAPDFAASAAAQARTTAVLDAVLTSQNRYGTAVKAGDATDSALQHDVSGILYVELGDAFAAGDNAALALLQAGRSQGLIPIIGRGQIQRVVAAVAKLKAVPPSIVRVLGPTTVQHLRSLVDGALTDANGGALNVLRTFPPPFSAASLIPPSGWVTNGELRAVIAQLVAQGAVPAATGTALDGVLDSLLEASTPAAVAQGLSQFTTDAGQVPGETGTFLEAAAHALTA